MAFKRKGSESEAFAPKGNQGTDGKRPKGAPAKKEKRTASSSKTLARICAAAVAVAVIAVGFGLTSWVSATSLSDKVTGSMTKVVVSNQQIPAGSQIKAEQLSFAEVPAEYLPTGSISEPSSVIGETAVTEIASNTVLTGSYVTGGANNSSLSRKLEPGMVAISIDVDTENSLAGLAKQGDRVGIYGLEEGSDGTIQSKLLYSDVKVLALDALLAGDSTTYTQLTLQVTPDQARSLVLYDDSYGDDSLRFVLEPYVEVA